jgi:hypothetical protein
MAKPEKRWQLLLVADDGRIIPFKRIKGVVVALVVLLFLLGLACAFLGWQWTAEKIRHTNARDQLARANRQLEEYKSKNELITAELVLARVRMEKAGMSVNKRQRPSQKQKPLKPAGASNTKAETAGEEKQPATVEKPPAKPPATPVSRESAEKAAEPELVAEKTAQKLSADVVLEDLEVRHDTEKEIVLARFKVRNNRLDSTKVAGRCVVVLKSAGQAPQKWLAMPKVVLKDGIPSGKQGRDFRISKFIDMDLMAAVETDPSVFKSAHVYVFEPSGALMLEKQIAVDLPPPKPKVAATPLPAEKPASPPKPKKPVVALGDLKMDYDPANLVLTARFRVRNAGPASSPVAGRCVVVMKDGAEDTGRWLSIPPAKMVNDEPDGTRGKSFRILRFRDMVMKAGEVADASIFTLAIVYVFDNSGAKLLEKSYPVTLPAPAPPKPALVEKPTQVPIIQGEKPEVPEAAASEPPQTEPAEPSPTEPRTDAAAETATTPEPAAAPAETPPSAENTAPAADDSRSRF